MNIIIILLLSIASYLIGSFPSGYVLTKIIKKRDITTFGSKNTGATNTIRILGKSFGILALLLDVLKGTIIMGILLIFKLEDYYLIGSLNIIGLYGVLAVLGHVYSIYLGFKGGKAVATSLGVLIFLNPWIALTVVVVFVIFAFGSKYVSLGSIMAASSAIVSALIFYLINPNKYLLENLIAIITLAIIIIYRHKENIIRLKNGVENKIGQKLE